MATSWTDIENGESGLDVRVKLNAFNAGVVTDIATNTSDVSDLQELSAFDYVKVLSRTVTNDVYETVGELDTVTDRSIGVYKITLSMMYTLNSTNHSAYFRFSMDGGSNWIEVRRESKDITDLIPETYSAVLEQTALEPINIIVQSRKEDSSNVLTISALDIMSERKE